jgi:hypothetical protein
MISRFGEVGMYAAAAILTVLFPYVSEASKRKQNAYRLIYGSTFAAIVFGLACSVLFYFFGNRILSLFPGGDVYSSYSPQMALLTLTMCLGSALNCTVLGFVAEENFRFLWWWLPFHAIYAGGLLFITGYGYAERFLPSGAVSLLEKINSCGLDFILVAMFLMQVAKLVFVSLPFNRMERRRG